MIHHSDASSARASGLRVTIALWFALILICIFIGCATSQLSRFKSHAADNDYSWVAAQKIDCDEASDVCGQLHLLRGDACFRLAKKAASAADDYACAADELEKGLSLSHTRTVAAEQHQFRENLCESLRNLQDLQSGETAAQTLTRFVAAAEGLNQAAPDSVPAIFYLAKAHLRQTQPKLIDVTAATRPSICKQLKDDAATVQSTIETARHKTLPEWKRFAGNYQRLSIDLNNSMQAAQCP